MAPAVYRGEGSLDVSIVQPGFDSAYLLFPLIENNLPGGPSAGHDPNQIQMTGFDVDLSVIGTASAAALTVMQTADPSLLHYRVPWSGGISSGGGQVAALVSVVPVELAAELATNGGLGTSPSLTLNARVQALGTTTNGTSMTSDPFNYPIEVCSGCLIGNLGPCPYKTTPTNLGNVCNPAQDAVVDCCTDNGTLICPAVVSTQ
ncbi:MAG TPA: hypothetical protein VMT03_15060 [Polyangia bacterium]|nr:hypothetical protein [Polyangia bacterium]